jgi:hypothetical protein
MSGRAAEAGGEVATTAKERVRDVAETAGRQTREVAAEAGQQAQGLTHEARMRARAQATMQRDRAATGLRSLGDELDAMATKGDQVGPATEVARATADRARALAGYLERREPGELLDDVREFARRRPGVFLLGALAAGVVAGRLTRGMAASAGTSGRPARTYLPEPTPPQSTEPLGSSDLTPGRPADQGAWPTPTPPAPPPRPRTESPADARTESRTESGTESW